ncbi:MAG: c-type cytochrome [Bacteriovoracaceae bacterium]
MTRLVVFSVSCILFFVVLGLSSYKELPVSNERFNYEELKKSHEARVATLSELEKKRAEMLAPKVAVEEEVVEEVLVVLDTPELEAGHKIYGKCISCHGKKGEGKVGQKAPKVGGQLQWYLVQSITQIRDQVRVNKKMYPFVKKLSDEDIQNVSTYISKLPW